MDYSSYRANYVLIEENSWHEVRSIHDDKYWNVTLEEVLIMG